jgi:polysaccharide biosynthesis transport protein
MPIKQLSQSKTFVPVSAIPSWISRIDVVRSLRLHKLLATLIAVSIIVLGLAFKARHKPSYAATSVVYVSPNFPATLKVSEEQEYPYDSYIEEQIHSVTGYNVLVNAIKKLPPGVWRFPFESVESAANRLQHMLTVKRDGLSYQVQISLTGDDPTHLAEIVNAVTDTYLDETRDEQFYGRDKRLDALRQERTEVQNDLNAKLQEQTEISQALGVARLSTDGPDQIDTAVTKLRADLSTAHEQRIQAEAQLSAMESSDPGKPNAALDAAADEIIASDSSVMALKASLNQKRSLLLDQLAGMTPNHPLRKTTEEQLNEIERALGQMQAKLRSQAAANLEQKLRMEVVRASTIESKLLSELEADTKEATKAAPSFQRSQVLKGQIAALQDRYATLDERTRNLELESKSPGPVHLFAAALPPDGPVLSVMRLIPVVIVPLGLLFATVTVVMIDFLDRHIYNSSDVEQILGFSPIGALFDDQDVSMQVFDEGILRMAGAIDQAARTAEVRTIVLTSVNSGGGTTSIVEDIGSTLAKLGRKTLTIDASGATSPVAYVTQQAAHHTLGSVPVKKQDVDAWSTAVVTQVIQQPFVPKLTPLTNLMDKAFKDLTIEYDMILIDAAPILISAETEYLARFADVTMLIAEAGKTTSAQLVRAARLLERMQVPGMAAVVNKIAYERTNHATREDVAAFEARMEQNVKWNGSWSRDNAPIDFEDREQPAKENSTYA